MTYDFIITGASVVDGTGKKAFVSDIGISGDRIADIGMLDGARSKHTIQADEMVVSPGFIDIHSHHDLYIVDQDPIKRFGSFVTQGVTSSVVGNCGWTSAPAEPKNKAMVLELIRSMGVPMEQLYWSTMSEYLSHIEKSGLMINIAQLVGHGAIRLSVMGDDNRFSTPEELKAMKALLKKSLDAGCVGLSTGLMYYPGMYAHTDELVALATVAAEYKRPYASHLRGYCTTLPDSIAEAVTIAQKSGVRVQISHVHAVPFFGKAAPIVPGLVSLFEAINSVIPMPGLPNPALNKGLAAINQAIDEGLDIGMDAVPYTLGNTTVTVLFPPWANRGGRARLLERLRDPETRERIEHDIKTIIPTWPHWEEGSWSDPYIRAIGYRPIRVLSVRGDENRWTEGKTFIEIADQWGTDPFSALCRLTLEEDGEVSFTFGFPARPWIEKMFNSMLTHPRMSIGADSILPVEGTPPPSAYGCFPRILGHYCRELKLFSLEEAIRKMTSLPSETYGLSDRGVLKKGAFADIVVFDPKTIDESFDENGRPAAAHGISHVFINGEHIVDGTQLHEKLRPGRVLRAS
jgi:N-acyl-D-aspartate/D-glutamate deacylase